MQATRLTDDVSRYEGVSQLYVGKQGCESLSESPFPRVPQGGEGMITTQRRVRSGSSIPCSSFVLLKTDTFGLACMFFGKLRRMFQFTNRVNYNPIDSVKSV